MPLPDSPLSGNDTQVSAGRSKCFVKKIVELAYIKAILMRKKNGFSFFSSLTPLLHSPLPGNVTVFFI